MVCEVNRLAIDGICGFAGQYREQFVSIENSKHQPPKFQAVPSLVEEMCLYANGLCRGGDQNAIETAAYLLWRVNWIHPFMDGNGRTARALSYLALLVGLDMELPGTRIVPEQLIDRPEDYYRALEKCDRAANASNEGVDVAAMTDLLSELLIVQFDSGV